MRWVFAGIVLAFIAVIGLAGCGGASEGAAEQEILARAPEIIGSAEQYRAEVKGVSAQRVDAVTLVGLGVKPSPDALIDTLTVTLRGVEYQRDPFQVTRVAEGTFNGRISEAAVNHYLQRQTPPTAGTPRLVRVQLQQGKITAITAVKAMNIELSITSTGRIDTRDGLHITYIPEKLELMDIPVPAAVRGLIVNNAFPLVDLTGLRFTPRITKLALEPGGILITGTAQVRGVGTSAGKP